MSRKYLHHYVFILILQKKLFIFISILAKKYTLYLGHETFSFPSFPPAAN